MHQVTPIRSHLWLITLLLGCSDEFVAGGAGPDATPQMDEVIVMEEDVPDCSPMGAGFEAVAQNGGWVCQCTISLFCGGGESTASGFNSSGWTIGPSAGPGPGAGGGTGMGGAGMGGAGGSGGADPCDPQNLGNCVAGCDDEAAAAQFGCATSGFGLPKDSIFCAPDQEGDCLGSHGLCAAGYRVGDLWEPKDGGRELWGGTPDKDCWPWPRDIKASKACWKKHEACSDAWFDTLYNSEECGQAWLDAGNACYQACQAPCQKPDELANP